MTTTMTSVMLDVERKSKLPTMKVVFEELFTSCIVLSLEQNGASSAKLADSLGLCCHF